MQKTKILVLTANPKDFSVLQLDREVKEIQTKIEGTRFADRIEVVTSLLTRREELIERLDYHQPHIVHFCGHGAKTGEIFLVSDAGEPQAIKPDTLKQVLESTKVNLRLAFLNACYTMGQAEAITQVIDFAVGTNAGIKDSEAIKFAGAFYRALGFGFSIGDAIKQGKAELSLSEDGQSARIEVLPREGLDPYTVRLIGPEALKDEIMPEPVQVVETDTTGRLFLSYAPTRSSDVRLIARALRDRGIPLSEEGLTEDKHFMGSTIKDALRSPGTAGGLLALSSDAVAMDLVKNVEVPGMLERLSAANGFFMIATQFPDVQLGHIGVSLYSAGVHIHKIARKKTSESDAAEIARRALAHRVSAIHKQLQPREPLRLELYTKAPPPFKPGTTFLVDWSERFTERPATPEQWTEHLLPALRDIAETVGANAPDRVIQADGRPSLPAVTALGCSFSQTRGIKIGWWQHSPGRHDELWSLDVPREASDFTIQTKVAEPDGKDLAVLVSAAPSRNVEHEFEASLATLPPFRAMVRVWKTPIEEQQLANAGQAADLAWSIRDAMGAAKNRFGNIECIHLFMAVPAGLAMMIGQFLNTLRRVQTYDLGPDGQYQPAALLRPSV